MKPIAIERADQHLEIARKAVSELDINKGFEHYQENWSLFLTQVGRFYSKLEQGSKGANQSENWFALKKHERKTDPLLSYLHQARNADEHGLDHVTMRMSHSSSYEFSTAKGEEYQWKIRCRENDDGTVEYSDPIITKDGKIVPTKLVATSKPSVALREVRNTRYGDEFWPPTSHLGVELPKHVSPEAVAALCVRYIKQMLSEARELPAFIELSKHHGPIDASD
jgi:hypothetical protein